MSMEAPRRRKGSVKRRLTLLAAVGSCAALVALQLPASAAALEDPTVTEVTGNATWFDALGSPYGGCGIPQANLDNPHFIALNVFNTPGDYTMYNRPLPEGDSKLGLWDNGHNCNRYVEVTVDDYCTGTNDGSANSTFCRNGTWVSDQYNGAKLIMQVSDSCADPNGWCRDDPYHIDLAKASINQFVKDGAQTTGLLDKWNNRHVSWKFIEAPNYTGDIKIAWLQSAQVWWPAIAVNHLRNGIRGVEYYQGDSWVTAKMNGDMGQSFIIGGLTNGASDFKIRVRDVNNELINDGREYSFNITDTCGSGSCSGAYTETKYTTSGGGTTEPSASADGSPSVGPSVPESTSPSSSASASEPASMSPSASSGTDAGCTASYTTTSSWQGGFQGEVTVKAGTSAVSSWQVTWTLASGQTLAQVWNGTLSTSGSTVTVSNTAWNGSLAANGSTTFGFVGNGSTSAPT
ncbi:MAG: cellulose binding domain-containing protein, partial [Micromonosporaceae bacterium]|nr:cellulose binding domain-containing protein [Micromonosporaceae bacterium]